MGSSSKHTMEVGKSTLAFISRRVMDEWVNRSPRRPGAGVSFANNTMLSAARIWRRSADIVESGESIDQTGLVRDPLPPSFERVSLR